MYYKNLNINDTEFKIAVNIAGAGAPTTETEGAVGMFYMDTNDGSLYKCIAVSGNVYTWIIHIVNAENVEMPDGTRLSEQEACKLPTVAASDNGKILQVNNGKWEAATIADTSVKTYIDEYIATALGGDY